MQTRIRLLGAVTAASLLISVTAMGVLERGTNPDIDNWFDVIWWWVVTSTTVGYGDIVPVTVAGRAFAVLTVVTGFYVFTSMIAIVAETTHGFVDRHRSGRAQVRAANHILICEYTAMADELIQSLPEIPELSHFRVVVASDLVERNPYPQHAFVQGVPINPAVLRQANCARAALVFIFANFRFADPDVKTLHIASRVRDQNPDAIVFVEIVDVEGELMEHVPDDLVVVSSRRAMQYVLEHKPVNPLQWLDEGSRQKLLLRLPPAPGRGETDTRA